MTQTEGPRDFHAPPLKTAPVFGGIAGIMSADTGDPSDDNNVPSMSYKARESGKLQDMYRRTLAASWAAQAGELPADECIEDIFAGGDGWGTREPGIVGTPNTPRAVGGSTEDDSDGDTKTVRGHRRNDSRKTSDGTVKPVVRHHRSPSKGDSTTSAVSGRGSIASQIQGGRQPKMHAKKSTHEIDEFAARDDLRSWEISANA